MYALLHQYLITHKELDLPGVGLLQVVEAPARYTMADKKLYAPHPVIRCKPERMQPNPLLYQWLSTQLQLSEVAAKQQFNQFMDGLLAELHKSSQFIWERLGIFTKQDNNAIKFVWQYDIQNYLPAVNDIDSIIPTTALAGKRSVPKSFWERNWIAWSFIGLALSGLGALMYFLVEEGCDLDTIINLCKTVLYNN